MFMVGFEIDLEELNVNCNFFLVVVFGGIIFLFVGGYVFGFVMGME